MAKYTLPGRKYGLVLDPTNGVMRWYPDTGRLSKPSKTDRAIWRAGAVKPYREVN